jgi:hypothetical protein
VTAGTNAADFLVFNKGSSFSRFLIALMDHALKIRVLLKPRES